MCLIYLLLKGKMAILFVLEKCVTWAHLTLWSPLSMPFEAGKYATVGKPQANRKRSPLFPTQLYFKRTLNAL